MFRINHQNENSFNSKVNYASFIVKWIFMRRVSEARELVRFFFASWECEK
jgi:hypothetical protein